MYHMDGSSPSGFTNSTFSGMNYTGNETTPNPSPSPSPLPSNTIVDYS